jgi:ABC-type transport system involved in cytochrome bd biosynthesis fused ATPase/permease subunit
MRRLLFLTVGMMVLILLLILPAAPSQAQTKEEKQFMKQHEKEMTTFMEKCSGCHSLQRILAKRRSKEEWDRVLKVMAGKPHANISEEDLKKIQKWIDFMQSTIPPGP